MILNLRCPVLVLQLVDGEVCILDHKSLKNYRGYTDRHAPHVAIKIADEIGMVEEIGLIEEATFIGKDITFKANITNFDTIDDLLTPISNRLVKKPNTKKRGKNLHINNFTT